jgi:DNA-binding MarR family transcriptional regulator
MPAFFDYSLSMAPLNADQARPKAGGAKKSKISSTSRAARSLNEPEQDTFSLIPTVSRPELLDKDGASDLVFRQFLYDFSVMAAYMEAVRTYLASNLELTPPQYNIVMVLAQHREKKMMSVSDVARNLHVTTAFITGEIRKLEHDGLVEKRRNPDDGRGVLLRLTSSGRARVQRTAIQRLQVNDRLFRKLSKEDFRHLSKTVASLIDDFVETAALLKATGEHRPAMSAAKRVGNWPSDADKFAFADEAVAAGVSQKHSAGI